jgi:hypothetical protein
MSTGPVVTIGGHEVYYGGRTRRPILSEPLSGSLDAHATLPQPAGHRHTIPSAAWQVSAVLAAGLLFLLAVILMRHIRR